MVLENATLLEDTLEKMQTNTGYNLKDLSHKHPVLLIFLRHFGCTFCREALAELSKKKRNIESLGTKIVFVHMSDESTANKYFERYELVHPIHVADPDCNYYQEFGLIKGNFNQLFGLKNWIRGFEAGLVKGHGIGSQLGDGFQMPGVFLINEGLIKDYFIHKSAADKPDYNKIVNCCPV